MHVARLRASRKRVTKQIANFKRELARDIKRELETRGMTQTEASYLTGEAPSQLSLICTGKLRGFSTERLLRTKAMLGSSVRITTSKSSSPSVSYVGA